MTNDLFLHKSVYCFSFASPNIKLITIPDRKVCIESLSTPSVIVLPDISGYLAVIVYAVMYKTIDRMIKHRDLRVFQKV